MTSTDVYTEMVAMTELMHKSPKIVTSDCSAYCTTFAMGFLRIQYSLLKIAEALENIKK